MFGTKTGCAIALVGAMTALPVMADEATERAILVLDASGSMWGQVDGTPKITIARDVIQGLVDDWNPNVELGVTAYGHREKGNCADIETLVPVGPVSGDQVTDAIGNLNPKGKTPLTDAVRQAAETLKYTEERATVLLVSDGKETCDADPCAAAAELEAAGIDFTVHVVGFDLTDEEKEQLQCVADNTGGKFLSADNAPELHTAMATTVQLVAEPEPEPEPAEPTGVKLTAVLAEGGVPVNAMFDVKKAEMDVDGKRELVERDYSEPEKPAIVELDPGSYSVTATYGKAERSVEIAVEAGEMIERTIVLPAGHLRLQAALTEGGEPVEARFDVHHAKQDLEGKKKIVEREYSKPGKPALLQLAEGSYFVEALHGHAEKTFEIDVVAGELVEQTVILGAGHLRLGAILTEGGEAVRTHFEIRDGAAADDDGKSPGVANLSGEQVTAELPAGQYHVVARYEEAEITENIELKAGELTDEILILGTGRLHVSAALTDEGEPIGAKIRILEPKPGLDGRHEMISGRSSKPDQPVGFGLPAGDYLVKAIYGDAEVTGNVRVKAGEVTEKVMVMNTGFVEAWGTRTEGGEPMHALIAVHKGDEGADRLNSHVTGAYSKDYKNARFALTAGRYRLIAKDGKGSEKTVEVDVKPGETIEVPIVLPAVD